MRTYASHGMSERTPKPTLVTAEEFDAALRTHGATIQSIIMALPTPPLLLTTPLLIRSMMPFVETSKRIVSFDLLRQYMAALYVLNDGLASNPHHERVTGELKRAQWDLLYGPPKRTDEELTLGYVHAYEQAIVKCMYLKRGDLEDDETLQAVLCMNERTMTRLCVKHYLCAPTTDAPSEAERARCAKLAEHQLAWRTTLNELVDQPTPEDDLSAQVARLAVTPEGAGETSTT